MAPRSAPSLARSRSPPGTGFAERAATAGPPQLPGPLTVRRRVSIRGTIMIGGQRIQVGLPHAGKTADVTVESDTYQITVADGVAFTAPRKTSRAINRHKASDYGEPNRDQE